MASDERMLYERYAAWCGLVGVRAADFETWKKISRSIPSVHPLSESAKTADTRLMRPPN
jgi:hypothetical protein